MKPGKHRLFVLALVPWLLAWPAGAAPDNQTAGGAPAAGQPAAQAEAAQGPALDLLTCVEEALANSPDLGVSLATIRKARASKMVATGARLPNLSINYTELAQKRNKTSYKDVHSWTGTLDWVLFSGGALQANSNIARLSEIAGLRSKEATVNSVINTTVTAYLQVLKAQELKAVCEHTVDLAKQQLHDSQLSYDAENAAKIDVLTAQAAVANANQSLLKANNSIELAKASLANAMGRKQTEPLTVKPMERQMAVEPDLLESLKLAVAQRPELKAQQASIKINEQAVKAAKAGYYPTVAFEGKLSHTDPLGTGGVVDMWQAYFVFNWNAWDWGQTRGKVDEAKTDLTVARNQFETMVRGIELAVHSAVLNINEARQRIEQATAEVDSSSEALRIAELRYREQAGTYLELLDARRTLSTAEANLVTAYYDNALAEADWLGATGGYVVGDKMTLPGNETTQAKPVAERKGQDLPTVQKEFGLDASAGKPNGDLGTPAKQTPAAPNAPADAKKSSEGK